MAKNEISGWSKSSPQNFFSLVLPPLDVTYCCNLSLYAIARKTHDLNLTKWQKTSFWAWFSLIEPIERPFFFKNIASSVIRYRGWLSSCKIAEKTNHSVLRKISDRRTDGRTDGQTHGHKDESEFIGHCPTDVNSPIFTWCKVLRLNEEKKNAKNSFKKIESLTRHPNSRYEDALINLEQIFAQGFQQEENLRTKQSNNRFWQKVCSLISKKS